MQLNSEIAIALRNQCWEIQKVFSFMKIVTSTYELMLSFLIAIFIHLISFIIPVIIGFDLLADDDQLTQFIPASHRIPANKKEINGNFNYSLCYIYYYIHINNIGITQFVLSHRYRVLKTHSGNHSSNQFNVCMLFMA